MPRAGPARAVVQPARPRDADYCLAREPRADARLPRRAAAAARGAAAAGRAQRRQRAGGARDGRGARTCRARRCSTRCARSAACRTARSGWPTSAACATSTTPRAPTSARRSPRSPACAGPLVLIAGGDGKGQDFAPLRAAFRGKVRHVVLIGRDAPRARRGARRASARTRARDRHATPPCAPRARAAQPGDTVLLSPACASLDMFRDYAHRGDVFAAAVQEPRRHERRDAVLRRARPAGRAGCALDPWADRHRCRRCCCSAW